MKQVKFREPHTISIPDDLYSDLVEMQARGDLQDTSLQGFTWVLLRRGMKVEEEQLQLQHRQFGVGALGQAQERGRADPPGGPPGCRIVDLASWKQRHT